MPGDTTSDATTFWWKFKQPPPQEEIHEQRARLKFGEPHIPTYTAIPCVIYVGNEVGE